MPIINTVLGGVGGSGSGSTALFFSIQLPRDLWKDDEDEITTAYLTVEDENFIVDNYSYFVAPAQNDYLDYINASIRAFDIAEEGQITFVCLKDNKPTDKEYLTVDVLRVEETYE